MLKPFYDHHPNRSSFNKFASGARPVGRLRIEDEKLRRVTHGIRLKNLGFSEKKIMWSYPQIRAFNDCWISSSFFSEFNQPVGDIIWNIKMPLNQSYFWNLHVIAQYPSCIFAYQVVMSCILGHPGTGFYVTCIFFDVASRIFVCYTIHVWHGWHVNMYCIHNIKVNHTFLICIVWVLPSRRVVTSYKPSVSCCGALRVTTFKEVWELQAFPVLYRVDMFFLHTFYDTHF